MEEIWKEIEGFPRYKISNYGNVYSERAKKQLAPILGTHGYYTYTLYSNKKAKIQTAHKLVANHFLEFKDHQCINHIDQNKLNNFYKNLEYCTYSHNTRDAYRKNRFPDKNGVGIKYTKDEIIKICEMLQTKRPIDVHRETGFNLNTIRSIKRKNIWLELTSSYNFLDIKDSGVNRYNAKFSKEDVKMIRQKYLKNKTSSRKLAAQYGCSKSTILGLVNNKTYKLD